MNFTSPLTVPVGKKNFSLNQNIYRNSHHQVLNQAKVNYKQIMANQMRFKKPFDKVTITYTLYPKTKRRTDISNVLSIHSKFFEDCLVEHGLLVDDNYNYLPIIIFLFGMVDKDNPRVEIEVKEIAA